MIGFVVVSHNKKLVDEAIKLGKMMQYSDFKILNAGGLRDNDEFGTDASLIMEKINEANEGDGVLVFCELGSSMMNSQMAVEMINDKKVKLVDAPLLEGLIVGISANSENISLEDLIKEILEVKNINKL